MVLFGDTEFEIDRALVERVAEELLLTVAT